MKTAAIILAAAAATAVAMCPNQCSGHGACTADDQCRCWKGYSGYDCAKRSCPVVESWGMDNAENPHAYQECGGKGICDHTTGSCSCFDGFEGAGCERSSCPNACSGHGKCRMLADMDSYAAGRLVQGGWAYTWDEKAIQVCECDGGYMGADCSQRICPHGDDPMTVCEQGFTEQVQKVSFSIAGDHSGTDADFTGGAQSNLNKAGSTTGVALRFKSYANEVFYTSTVTNPFGVAGGDDAVIKGNLKNALQGVPNFRIREVGIETSDITVTEGATDVTAEYTVTFLHENSNQNNYGEQHLLMCPHSRAIAGSTRTTFGCGADGCQPKILQPRTVLETHTTCTAGDCAGSGIQVAAATVTTAAVAPGSSLVSFTPGSVLTCPVGASCNAASASAHQGSVVIFVERTASDYNIYARGQGAGVSGLSTTTLQVSTDGTLTHPGAASVTTGMTDVPTQFGLVYLGRYTDFGGVVGAAGSVTVDISEIMADSAVVISEDAELNAAGEGKMYQLHFSTAMCHGAVDITVDGTGNGIAFNNLDVENIECSGRGECDRTSGNCACFEGYTGLACGSQTILI